MLTHPALATLMLLAGGLAAIQAALDARLAGFLGSPVRASFVSFSVGALALLTLLRLARDGLPSPTRLASVPPVYLIGGVLGVAFITTAVFLVPRIGVVEVLFVGQAGQMIVSVLIDHRDLFGLERHPLNVWKLAGLALIVIGVVLIKRDASAVPDASPLRPPAAVKPAVSPVQPGPPAARAISSDAAARALRRAKLRSVKARTEPIRRQRFELGTPVRPAGREAAGGEPDRGAGDGA